MNLVVIGRVPPDAVSCTTAKRSGTLTGPGAPAGPSTTRPSTPTFITMLPPTSAHSRASRTKLAWYFMLIAVRSPAGPMLSVAAPRRTSAAGQLTSGGGGCAWASLAESAAEPEASDEKLFVSPAPLIAALPLTPSRNKNVGASSSAQPYFCSRLSEPDMTPPLVHALPPMPLLYQAKRGQPKADKAVSLCGATANDSRPKART